MTIPVRRSLAHVIRDAARPLAGARDDFDPVMALVGDARVVLIGEASHGTHEFYRIRAEITKRLIRERGFGAIAAEADWPDAYRINRYVRGTGTDADASEALNGFRRFPQWMWRNADVLDFVGWLREFNEQVPDGNRKVGFYGLDLYSLHASMAAVLEYLRVVDPAAAKRAQYRYACFEQFGEDPQAYGYAASYGLAPSCEREVVEQLVDLRRSAADYAQRDGRVAADDLFFTEQNARVVRNAERYYRAMFGSRVQSWNLRDQHMTDTLQALVSFLDRSAPGSKVVVWAHNSHVGDARATELGAGGELNVGQLTRQQFGAGVVALGFTTFRGTVTAASDWDAPAERKVVRPALPESFEAVFHDAPRNFFLDLRTPSAVATALDDVRIERAIGVIYRPETERLSHYFSARLSRQFDGILHYDETRAVEPLERSGVWDRGEVPETFPTAL
ncbi:MAG TPA: erythromycin esterase family protein [Gemmatimonadaceae bacterium]|nr:erythromycin esterase family protein [Gemmatimonadaceae bacterium]